jgi:hypothetical protein
MPMTRVTSVLREVREALVDSHRLPFQNVPTWTGGRRVVTGVRLFPVGRFGPRPLSNSASTATEGSLTACFEWTPGLLGPPSFASP